MTQFLADNPAVVKQATARKTKTSVLDLSPLLIATKEGTPRAVLANAITMLRYHPEWNGVLAFNEFSLRVVNKKGLPWSEQTGRNWADCDDSLCADWLQHNGVLVNSKVAGEAAQTVAHENGFHPVRDYLTGLCWDGKPRLDSSSDI
jgi:putative DNA primase/helicase